MVGVQAHKYLGINISALHCHSTVTQSRRAWLVAHAEIEAEAAKGADLWSIFSLTGFTYEEAYQVYQDAAEHDNSFTFPVTLKDKTEMFTMIFRFVCFTVSWQFISSQGSMQFS